jgi:hypothetical protein
MSGKVMFRGDDRHPVTNNIFTNGFTKRGDPTVFPDPVYRSGGTNKAGDLDPQSGVCVSVRFQGAALFPLKFDATDPAVTTYIYAVYVDTKDLLNTHQLQVMDALGQKVGGQWQNPKSARNANWSTKAPMWPLFAHEMAVNDIPAGHIISAIKCDRNWTGQDWTFGGTYQLGTLFHNPGCNAPETFIDAARSFLGGEFSSHSNSPLPDGVSGYNVSELV